MQGSDHAFKKRKLLIQEKKIGCSARIVLRDVMTFPSYKVWSPRLIFILWCLALLELKRKEHSILMIITVFLVGLQLPSYSLSNIISSMNYSVVGYNHATHSLSVLFCSFL